MLRKNKELSAEEIQRVEVIVKRKFRYMTLAEEHADIVRKQGSDVFTKAYADALKIFNSDSKTRVTSPPMGTNMEEYYGQFEPALNADAKTPSEHIYIVLVASGLATTVNATEYAHLSEYGQTEVARRFGQQMKEFYNPNGPPPVGKLPRHLVPEKQLPSFPPIEADAQIEKLDPARVKELLENFNLLHHKILIDDEECYKIVDVNYSRLSRAIESFEVQFEDCCDAIDLSFEEVEEMLLRSSMVIE